LSAMYAVKIDAIVLNIDPHLISLKKHKNSVIWNITLI
jgi:hypothetical protein